MYNTNSREKLIERIKKLLAVTEKRGATKNEAIAAALAAQKLIAENDVMDYELEEGEEIVESVYARKTRNWQIDLGLVVAQNFRCKSFIRRKVEFGKRNLVPYIAFLGYKADAEAAKLVYEQLVKVCAKEAAEWTKTRMTEDECWGWPKASIHAAYVQSFIEGVKSVLEKQSMELMIVCPPKVKDAYDDFLKDAKFMRFKQTLGANDGATRNAGFAAGRDAVNAGRIGAADTGFMLTA